LPCAVSAMRKEATDCRQYLSTTIGIIGWNVYPAFQCSIPKQ